VDILGILQERGLRFSLVTNGWELGGYLDTLGQRLAMLQHVSISIEGPNAPTHDGMRGPGSFERATAAARLCKAMGVPCAVRSTVTHSTPGHLDDLLALCNDLGAKALVLIPLMPTRRMAELGALPTPQDLQKVSAWACSRMCPTTPRVVLAAGYFTLDIARPCPSFACRSLFVTARGDISFCCQLAGNGDARSSGDLLGSLHRMSLSEAAERARRLAKSITSEKEALERSGRLTYLDRHPCWYCLRRFGKVGWLSAFPDSPWGADPHRTIEGAS
jgi:MoaA/NifB/PqqE/SkfB family radical SAM enzyme